MHRWASEAQSASMPFRVLEQAEAQEDVSGTHALHYEVTLCCCRLTEHRSPSDLPMNHVRCEVGVKVGTRVLKWDPGAAPDAVITEFNHQVRIAKTRLDRKVRVSVEPGTRDRERDQASVREDRAWSTTRGRVKALPT